MFNKNNKLTSIIFAIAFFGSVQCSKLSDKRAFYDSRPGQKSLTIYEINNGNLFSIGQTIFLNHKLLKYQVLNIKATDKSPVSLKEYEANKLLRPIYLKLKQATGDRSDYYFGLLVKNELYKSDDQTSTVADGSGTDYKLFFQKENDDKSGYTFVETTIGREELETLRTFPSKSVASEISGSEDEVTASPSGKNPNKIETDIRFIISGKQYKVLWDKARMHYNLEEETNSSLPATT
jgi:hypothetical protein